jgi:transposase
MISHLATRGGCCAPRRSPAEFRRKVLDLVAAGRPVAYDVQISAQEIYTWRQQLIDSGQIAA